MRGKKKLLLTANEGLLDGFRQVQHVDGGHWPALCCNGPWTQEGAEKRNDKKDRLMNGNEGGHQ